MSDKYANVYTTWEFSILGSTENFTETEFAEIDKGIANWADENLISPYKLVKTNKGFEVTLGTFCHEGAGGMAQDLFLFLARNVFRTLEKSVGYGRK
jgi:hypothetical protein